MEQTDCIVVGAGVVGLAIARALARAGREVIHAGIYYPTGLVKQRLCVAGKEMLYRFCADYHVPHRRIGKLLVAVNEAEIPKLEAIKALAEANGVTDLVWLSAAEAHALEPEVRSVRALLSPSTGIVDSHALMLALQGDAEAHGAMLALETPVVAGRVTGDGIVLETGGATAMTLRANTVINSAGLGAQALARAITGMPVDKVPPLHLAKGNYFTLAGKSPFSRLIYPMPSAGGLGVHVTLDIGGGVRFGPDVEWLDAVHYPVDPARASQFYAAIRHYWPGLPDGALQPGYSGIRPKIERPGGSTTDFLIQGPEAHGVPGLVNLFGIESPGLTSSLAIAEMVSGMV